MPGDETRQSHPPVRAGAVAGVRDDLRRHVLRRTAERVPVGGRSQWSRVTQRVELPYTAAVCNIDWPRPMVLVQGGGRALHKDPAPELLRKAEVRLVVGGEVIITSPCIFVWKITGEIYRVVLE